MPDKGQGFLEKCNVARKIEQKGADARRLASVPGDDMQTKKNLAGEGLRQAGCQSYLEDSGAKRTTFKLPKRIRSQCRCLR